MKLIYTKYIKSKFYNYSKFLEKVSLLINYVSFTTKIFIIFKSLIENFSVRGEGKDACQVRTQVLRLAVRKVWPLALRLREGAHYFQAGAYLLRGFGKQYHTGLI